MLENDSLLKSLWIGGIGNELHLKSKKSFGSNWMADDAGVAGKAECGSEDCGGGGTTSIYPSFSGVSSIALNTLGMTGRGTSSSSSLSSLSLSLPGK